ncbi:hypothetical protein GALMADRAFT_221988 [Galerina marginata CBS 339.88]|uniref:Uncharacterized protein n=1 Tax=Galerina marginata (strain CBS 339.88) TaxID=685588 RepID=A0A067TT01_GALM3|nr:hypothetical protein GALMADRAFT_221988 [Galerina marginata CBS 339.88]
MAKLDSSDPKHQELEAWKFELARTIMVSFYLMVFVFEHPGGLCSPPDYLQPIDQLSGDDGYVRKMV